MQRKKRIIPNGMYSIRNHGSQRVPHVLIGDSEEYKYCSKCNSFKELDEFNDNKNTWDNKTSFCRECTAKVLKRNYQRKKYLKLGLPFEEEEEVVERRKYTLKDLHQIAVEQLGTDEYQLVDYVMER